MEITKNERSSSLQNKWKKIAYGGMQLGFEDNYTDDSFLEEMIMNANVVKRDLFKVMLDSVSITQYLCIVGLVVLVWVYTLRSMLNEDSLLLLNVSLLGSGFLVLVLTAETLSFQLLVVYILKISFFIIGLYMLSPIYQTLTRSISCDSIWALTASLIILHLFLHNYAGSPVTAAATRKSHHYKQCISKRFDRGFTFNRSRLPSSIHVFHVVLFSLQVFLFAPLVTYCVRKRSFHLHLFFSCCLSVLTLICVCTLHRLLCVLMVVVLGFVNVVCPFWLIRIHEYKFEMNGPWDEAKLCFNIAE